MTRITNMMMVNTMMRNMYGVMGAMDKSYEQLSTMSKVNRPSDDPIAMSRILRIRDSKTENEQFTKNSGYAKTWLDITDTALDQANQAIIRAKELAVQGANGVYDEAQRESMAKEIDQLLQHIVEIGNSSYEGRYIFAGYRSNLAPYELTSKGANFPGNTGDVITEVARGVMVPYNVPNNRAFLINTEDNPVTSTSPLGELVIDPRYPHTELADKQIRVRVSGIDDDGNAIRIQADFGNGFGGEIPVPWSDPENKQYPIAIGIGNDMTFTLNGTSKVGDLHRFTVSPDGGSIELQVETKANEVDGSAMAGFTTVGRSDIGYRFNADDAMTFNFVIGSKHYSLRYQATAANETTATIANFFAQSEMKDILDVYGEGQTPPWRTDPLGAGEMVMALKGDASGEPFDFWVSNLMGYNPVTKKVDADGGEGINGVTGGGGLPLEAVTYVPSASFGAVDAVPPVGQIVTGGAVVNNATNFRLQLTEKLYMKDAVTGRIEQLANGADVTANFRATAVTLTSATYNYNAVTGEAYIDFVTAGSGAGSQLTVQNTDATAMYDAVGNRWGQELFVFDNANTRWKAGESTPPLAADCTMPAAGPLVLSFNENLYNDRTGTNELAALTPSQLLGKFKYVDKDNNLISGELASVTYNNAVAGAPTVSVALTGTRTPVAGDRIKLQDGDGFFDLAGNEWSRHEFVFNGTDWVFHNPQTVPPVNASGVNPEIDPDDPMVGMLVGNYTTGIGLTKTGEAVALANYQQYAKSGENLVTGITVNTNDAGNISLMLRISETNPITGTAIDFDYDAYITAPDGTVTQLSGSKALGTNLTMNAGATNNFNLGGFDIDIDLDNIQYFSAPAADDTVRDTIVINAQDHAAVLGANYQQVTVKRDDVSVPDMQFAFDPGFFNDNNTTHRFNFFQVNATSGTVKDVSVGLSFAKGVWDADSLTGLDLESADPTTLSPAESYYRFSSTASFEIKNPPVVQERDVFAALADFRDALNDNDEAGIQKGLDEMGRALDNVLTWRADVGAKTNRIEFTVKRLEENDLTLTDLEASLQDVDLAQAIMDLKNQENVYQAILATGARIIQPTLVDFLR